MSVPINFNVLTQNSPAFNPNGLNVPLAWSIAFLGFAENDAKATVADDTVTATLPDTYALGGASFLIPSIQDLAPFPIIVEAFGLTSNNAPIYRSGPVSNSGAASVQNGTVNTPLIGDAGVQTIQLNQINLSTLVGQPLGSILGGTLGIDNIENFSVTATGFNLAVEVSVRGQINWPFGLPPTTWSISATLSIDFTLTPDTSPFATQLVDVPQPIVTVTGDTGGVFGGIVNDLINLFGPAIAGAVTSQVQGILQAQIDNVAATLLNKVRIVPGQTATLVTATVNSIQFQPATQSVALDVWGAININL
jgi:hypothetical protein